MQDIRDVDFDNTSSTHLPTLDWINPWRVRNAIDTFKNFKAGGMDDIKPIILKNLPIEAMEWISAIYTACIHFRYTPRQWRLSRTVFIPKPGRADYTIPKAYRPISLTSFFLKTLERLALWHLEQTSFLTHPFHDRQYAFRKGLSTDSALTQVISTIEKAVFYKKQALTVFLDIEGAFDNLDTTAAIAAMDAHRVPQEVAGWYASYLKDRYSIVSYGNDTHQRIITRGTPQGGVLSPILWNFRI